MPTPIYYPPEDNGLQKTLNSALLTGVTASATLNNANKIQNKPGVIVIDRIDTNGALKAAADREYIVYTGVSGSTLTGLTRGVGGSTDQDHSIGAIVEFVPDVVVHQMIADGLAVLLDASDVSAVNTTNVVTPTGTQDLSNKTLVSPLFEGTIDGWTSITETLTYASATTITIAAGGASRYQKGDKLKLTQTTVKYFYIIGVADELLTITGGSDYTLANEAITSPQLSRIENPFGFPDYFNYTPTLTGFSANPTFTAIFSIKGKYCFLKFTCSTNGTSNATTFTVSLPVNSGGQLWKQVVQVVDNGTNAAGMAIITTAGGTVGIRANVAEGNFTNSGNKSANLEIFYLI